MCYNVKDDWGTRRQLQRDMVGGDNVSNSNKKEICIMKVTMAPEEFQKFDNEVILSIKGLKKRKGASAICFNDFSNGYVCHGYQLIAHS